MFELGHKTDGLLPAMCCWNDDNGNFSGKLVKLDLHEAIEIESCVMTEDFDLEGIACEFREPKFDDRARILFICGSELPFWHHRTWVGDIFWDLIWMKPPDVLRLINLLHDSRQFGIESGDSQLFNVWELKLPTPFGADHLRIIEESAKTFRL